MKQDPIEEMRLSIERSISRINLLIQNNPRNEGSLFDRNLATIKALDQLYIEIGSMSDNTGLGKIVNQHKQVANDISAELDNFTFLYEDVERTVDIVNRLRRKDYFELSAPQNQIKAPADSETIPDEKLLCNRFYKKILGRTLD